MSGPGPAQLVSGSSIRPWVAFILCFFAALPFVLTNALTQGITHDEHQHIAAGALVAREGLLPYRDFPHFHTPYLSFIYAALFRGSDHLLLVARLFSAICAAAAAGLVGAATAGAFRARGWRVAIAAAGVAIVLVLSARVFTHTTGYAWNHEPPLLCALTAFLLVASGLRAGKVRLLFAGGVLLGLAIGLRLTYAPLLAPFGLATLIVAGPAALRIGRAASFSAGVLLALSGVAWLASVAPEQAYFANFDFAKVNITYRFATGEPRTMTWPTKIRYVFKNIARPDAALLIAFVAPFAAALYALRTRSARFRPELLFLLGCLPFVLVGALAPSPLFEQYFYPFVFFLVLGGAYALSSLPPDWRWTRLASYCVAAAALVAAIRAFPAYDRMPELAQPSGWTPLEKHAEAASLRLVPPEGRVLTLGPIPVLEAGRRIYPQFSTGPFAWRIGPFVEPAKAARLRIPVPSELERFLASEPPAALLLGTERKGEGQLVRYARDHGYRLQPVGTWQLWLRP